MLHKLLTYRLVMGNQLSLDELKESNFTQGEIQRLYTRFQKLDKDGSGTISKTEFLSLPQIKNNPLATRLIHVFDHDHSGDVDFKEFITALSYFSSRGSTDDKLRFAFKVYDIDQDGFISNGELFITLKMMVGSNLTEEQLQQLVDKTIMQFDTDNDGKISFDEFSEACKSMDFLNGIRIESKV